MQYIGKPKFDDCYCYLDDGRSRIGKSVTADFDLSDEDGFFSSVCVEVEAYEDREGEWQFHAGKVLFVTWGDDTMPIDWDDTKSRMSLENRVRNRMWPFIKQTLELRYVYREIQSRELVEA